MATTLIKTDAKYWKIRDGLTQYMLWRFHLISALAAVPLLPENQIHLPRHTLLVHIVRRLYVSLHHDFQLAQFQAVFVYLYAVQRTSLQRAEHKMPILIRDKPRYKRGRRPFNCTKQQRQGVGHGFRPRIRHPAENCAGFVVFQRDFSGNLFALGRAEVEIGIKVCIHENIMPLVFVIILYYIGSPPPLCLICRAIKPAICI